MPQFGDLPVYIDPYAPNDRIYIVQHYLNSPKFGVIGPAPCDTVMVIDYSLKCDDEEEP